MNRALIDKAARTCLDELVSLCNLKARETDDSKKEEMEEGIVLLKEKIREFKEMWNKS